MTKNTKYNFKHFETALTAFIANIEKKINNIDIDLPTFILETGDVTYIFKEKFEKLNEVYLKVPRIVIQFEDLSIQTEQDTNQYTTINYQLNNKIFSAAARRKAINIPIILKLVNSNFLTNLEYLEMLLSILSVDNVFTYEFLRNTYQGSYALTTLTTEKNSTDFSGSTKNFVINCNLDLQLQAFIIRYNSIKELNNVSENFDETNLIENESNLKNPSIITSVENGPGRVLFDITDFNQTPENSEYNTKIELPDEDIQ